jgi:hypothetical protein
VSPVYNMALELYADRKGRLHKYMRTWSSLGMIDRTKGSY